MGVAVFDYALWALRYPTLASKVSEPLAAEYFAEAELILNNTESSLVTDVPQRLRLLNMLVAHIAILNGANDPAGAIGPVGRIASATEGSVSASFAYRETPGSEAWYAQTQYGAAYWLATAPYRQATYFPGVQPNFEPYGGGFGNQGSGLWGTERWWS